MSPQALNLLVFREGRTESSAESLKTALAQQLKDLRDEQSVIRALLRAGELECAAADSGFCQNPFEKITDSLAEALVKGACAVDSRRLLSLVEQSALPEMLTISVQEGFAYYALHPLAFADVLSKFSLLPAKAMVIGIRSIGATLSAVTTAALRRRGVQASRTTVRPNGHPYNRRTELAPEQMEMVRHGTADDAEFLVVDEGPGLSGSSFLSVAEALKGAGVPTEKITLICSHEPEIDRLCAENAAERWRRFRHWAADSPPRLPAGAKVFAGGGEWRRYFLPNESLWPASWTSFEGLKYLSGDADAPRLYKFVGLGHYGDQIFEREQKIANGGFGPVPEMEAHGFMSCPVIGGRPMMAADISESVLARLAAYCGFRARKFAVQVSGLEMLQQMADHNSQELRLGSALPLRLERPVLADGRMQPHEWLLTHKGQMLKTDSGSHGDDHFFPGKTDIAWDLAGAIVEWQMQPAQADSFLEMYRRASGDDARPRIAPFIRAYTVFRCAYCMMAANALQGTEEQSRMERQAASYGILEIGSSTASPSPYRGRSEHLVIGESKMA